MIQLGTPQHIHTHRFYTCVCVCAKEGCVYHLQHQQHRDREGGHHNTHSDALRHRRTTRIRHVQAGVADVCVIVPNYRRRATGCAAGRRRRRSGAGDPAVAADGSRPPSHGAMELANAWEVQQVEPTLRLANHRIKLRCTSGGGGVLAAHTRRTLHEVLVRVGGWNRVLAERANDRGEHVRRGAAFAGVLVTRACRQRPLVRAVVWVAALTAVEVRHTRRRRCHEAVAAARDRQAVVQSKRVPAGVTDVTCADRCEVTVEGGDVQTQIQVRRGRGRAAERAGVAHIRHDALGGCLGVREIFTDSGAVRRGGRGGGTLRGGNGGGCQQQQQHCGQHR